MPKINRETLNELRMPLPPATEQVTIAGFLDADTTRLDMLVAKKRALVERLQEKRAALISRTVTRGLPSEAARAAGLDPHPASSRPASTGSATCRSIGRCGRYTPGMPSTSGRC
jgi:type I restriction enzyme S subunit